MSGKHTPGPWSYTWSMAGRWLVKLHSGEGLHEFTLPQDREDDARLVTSAPALLLALEEIEEFHIPDQPIDSSGDELAWAQKHVAKLRQIARAAIAKARGETA